MTAPASLAAEMRAAGRALLDAAPADRSGTVHRRLDDERLRWLEYRPQPRPGVSLGEFGAAGRKAAHRLLATGLRPHAYAQAMTILGLEEVLDRQEGWRRGRHSNDYRVVVFGDPADERWLWRFEGHHLSVTMAVSGEGVSPAPVFFGANPAAVRHAGRDVLRPLAAEEDVARALLDAMGAAARGNAIVSTTAPPDIHTATRPRVDDAVRPLGLPADRLDARGRALLGELLGLYLDRVPAGLLAIPDLDREAKEWHFAWEGGQRRGDGHYYRVQGPDMIIEYDNTADGANHAHTVLRRPRAEFGGDPLAEHAIGPG